MRTHAFRLTPGIDLKAELQRLTGAHALRAGCVVTCVGSLSRARLRMPGAAGETDVFASFAEPMEIISLAGTLCPEGLHLHICLARRDASCIGGHVVEGCIVSTTAELVRRSGRGRIAPAAGSRHRIQRAQHSPDRSGKRPFSDLAPFRIVKVTRPTGAATG